MKALEKAIGIIRWQATDKLRISDLVSQTGVSRRTLESAFQDGIGVSPAAYLKATRLRALNRSLLQAARDESSVANLCQQHGFSHLGQLASDYRAMFGELPSTTLRR
jgi:AraC family ethanolamine operon transcriptional activator